MSLNFVSQLVAENVVHFCVLWIQRTLVCLCNDEENEMIKLLTYNDDFFQERKEEKIIHFVQNNEKNKHKKNKTFLNKKIVCFTAEECCMVSNTCLEEERITFICYGCVEGEVYIHELCVDQIYVEKEEGKEEQKEQEKEEEKKEERFNFMKKKKVIGKQMNEPLQIKINLKKENNIKKIFNEKIEINYEIIVLYEDGHILIYNSSENSIIKFFPIYGSRGFALSSTNKFISVTTKERFLFILNKNNDQKDKFFFDEKCIFLKKELFKKFEYKKHVIHDWSCSDDLIAFAEHSHLKFIRVANLNDEKYLNLPTFIGDSEILEVKFIGDEEDKKLFVLFRNKRNELFIFDFFQTQNFFFFYCEKQIEELYVFFKDNYFHVFILNNLGEIMVINKNLEDVIKLENLKQTNKRERKNKEEGNSENEFFNGKKKLKKANLLESSEEEIFHEKEKENVKIKEGDIDDDSIIGEEKENQDKNIFNLKQKSKEIKDASVNIKDLINDMAEELENDDEEAENINIFDDENEENNFDDIENFPAFEDSKETAKQIGKNEKKIYEEIKKLKHKLKTINHHFSSSLTQQSFQPGATTQPDDVNTPWCLFWNQLGNVIKKTENEKSYIEISYHENFSNPKRVFDLYNYSFAALSNSGYALASASLTDDEMQPCILEYHPWEAFNSVEKSRWSKKFCLPEQIECLAVGFQFVAVLTSNRYLRIYSDSGCIISVTRVKGLPVCLCAYENLLFVVSTPHFSYAYNYDSCIANNNIEEKFEENANNNDMVDNVFYCRLLLINPTYNNFSLFPSLELYNDELTLPGDVEIDWINISENGIPIIKDTSGIIYGLYPVWGGLNALNLSFSFVPIFNFSEMEISQNFKLFLLYLNQNDELVAIKLNKNEELFDSKIMLNTSNRHISLSSLIFQSKQVEKYPLRIHLNNTNVSAYDKYRKIILSDPQLKCDTYANSKVNITVDEYDEFRYRTDLNIRQLMLAFNCTYSFITNNNRINFFKNLLQKYEKLHDKFALRLFRKAKDKQLDKVALEAACLMRLNETLKIASSIIDKKEHRRLSDCVESLQALRNKQNYFVDEHSSAHLYDFSQGSLMKFNEGLDNLVDKGREVEDTKSTLNNFNFCKNKKELEEKKTYEDFYCSAELNKNCIASSHSSSKQNLFKSPFSMPSHTLFSSSSVSSSLFLRSLNSSNSIQKKGLDDLFQKN